MKLTREERKAIYRGASKLSRPTKPEVKAGDSLVIAWSRGGKRVVDRETGETAEMVRRPTLWIEFREPRLDDNGEWTVPFQVHDERETIRLLAGVPSGPTESALKTRWRPPEQVPGRGEQTESFTPESERGYTSGGNRVDYAECVDDATYERFAREAKERHEAEHPEEVRANELRRLSTKARRLQKEAERAGVDLSADLTLFIERARETIHAHKRA